MTCFGGTWVPPNCPQAGPGRRDQEQLGLTWGIWGHWGTLSWGSGTSLRGKGLFLRLMRGPLSGAPEADSWAGWPTWRKNVPRWREGHKERKIPWAPELDCPEPRFGNLLNQNHSLGTTVSIQWLATWLHVRIIGRAYIYIFISIYMYICIYIYI